MQGASAGASWGCARAPPTLRLRLSGLRLGSGGPACHEHSCTPVRTPRRFPRLVPASHGGPSLHSRRPGPRDGNLPPRGSRPPGLREPCLSAAPRGLQGAWGPDVRRGEGAGPSRLGAAPAVSRGRGVGPRARSPRSAGPSFLPSFRLGSGTRAGAVTTPFWLVISSPRRARRGRAAPLGLGAGRRGRPTRAWSPTRGSWLARGAASPGGRTAGFPRRWLCLRSASPLACARVFRSPLRVTLNVSGWTWLHPQLLLVYFFPFYFPMPYERVFFQQTLLGLRVRRRAC